MKKNTIILLFMLLMFSVSISSGETIYEVQFNDSDPGFIGCYPSPLLLNNVSITGVVTAVDPDDSSNFYIQDADSLWSGVFVSDAGSNLTPGDSVSFTGEVNEESDDGDGYTHLTNISGLATIVSGATVFTPPELTTGMLSQDCNDSAEAYEGMLVKVSTVDVTQEVDDDGYWMVDDGSGATTISNEYYIFTPVMGETIISITGIASSFSDGSDVYYKIIPRTASDIEAGGNRPPTISNVAIEPETPTDDDDITVSATVIDDTGIKSAYVYYGVDDNTTPDSASMSNSGSLYSATISALGSAGWFYYKVGATDDSNSTSTSSLDSVEVTGITNMADIQDNPSEWEGVTVTCQGVVTMGIDVIQTGLLNAYFQDNSGRGLNLFSFNQDPDYVAYVKRGFELIATGTITVYQGRTELENPVITFVDSNVTMPAPQILTTGQAASQNWDGTLVLVTGTILSVGAPSGGGSNVLIDDGSGEATIRIWETTGINTDDITVGETYNIKGIGGDYNGDKQIVPGYDEDIIPGEYIPGGVGVATISPTSVEADQSDLVETVTITADSAVTLDVIKIVIPSSWEWENPTASGVEYYGNGIDSSNVTVTIESNSIRLNGAAITNAASGIIRIKDLKSPVSPGTYTFQVLTSYDSNPLEEIALSPRVSVQGATKAFVQIPAKVLLPDFGEKIPITYAAPVNSDILIQVYDIEGTLIATLTDEEYDPVRSEVTWDGRDRHNEIVPIGVYICYVEATEKPSGRITTDKAPIVVAVPLN